MDLYNNFNKKISFKNENYQLPSVDLFYSTSVEKYEPLQIIKRILNFVKSKLNNFRIEEWGEHTRRRNPTQQIVFHLKNSIKGEFVTQAFAKFFECVNTYPLINENIEKGKFFSVHLCEAPGAFITSLNHYIKLHHPQTEFIWVASTLNPYYEGNSICNTILDDRLILHTLPSWFFGETYNGDIMNEDNLRSLVTHCKSIGNVDLVTCDGSIDCLDKPEEQEKHVSKLHTAELISSLTLLSDGGSLLIKIFTFFELTTVSMLFVLNCCFESVHLFKPATSKEGNSEVYVNCLGYRKDVMSSAHIEKLIANFKHEDKSMLPLSSIPHGFMDQITNAARFFMNQQVAVIENNIRTFRKYDKREFERIKAVKYQMVDEYVKLYQMKSISENQKLLHGVEFNSDLNLNERVHRGSYSDRTSFQNLTKSDQLQVLYNRLRELYQSVPEHPLVAEINPFSLSHCADATNFINLIRGKSIEKVVSSKFIIVSIFKYFNELRAFMEDDLCVQKKKMGDEETYNFTNVNNMVIKMEYFQNAESYDSYEKDVTMKILNHLRETQAEIFSIEGLPLLTQFIVGIIMYLSIFVFKEILLDRNTCKINFSNHREDSMKNLKYLIDVMNENINISSGIIGICDTRTLFTCNHQFYKSIIDYNNHLSLRFCSFFLNNISN